MAGKEKDPHQNPYLILRQRTRQLLSDVGIPSNPGFLDHDIVSGIRQKAGLPPVKGWNERSENSYELFRGGLIQTLQEAGVELAEEDITVKDIIRELRALLLD